MSTENPSGTHTDATVQLNHHPDSAKLEDAEQSELIDQANAAITKKKSDIIAEKYQLDDVIGQGGMGKIYKATQLKLNRTVAIKVMLAPEDKTATERFEAEASVTANLTHPNTIRIFDFGATEDGFLYLVMEHLDGINIKQYLKKNGALSPLLAAKLISEICGSLAEAHRKDIIHRDIKPGNIMLVESPEEGLRSKLLDFGLVKSLEGSSSRTRTGVILGSPMYMSPEQIDGQQLSYQSDLYSVGLTLYNMLTASKPFKEANLSGILAAQLFKKPKPLQEMRKMLEEYPALIWIVNTATEKKPQDRFRSAGQMKRALDCFLADPTSNLELIEGTLHQNGQTVDDITVFHAATSLQGSLIASNIDTSSVETETLHQPAVQEPQKKNSLGILMMALIGLVSIGIASIFFQKPSPPQTTVVTKPTTEVSTDANASKKIIEKKTEAPSTPILTEISLDTIPTGAIIFDENGEQLSNTPIKIKVEDKKKITIRLEGYEDEIVVLNVNIPEPVITLKAKPPKVKSSTKASTSSQNSASGSSNTKKNNGSKTEDVKEGVKKVTNPFKK